MQTTHGYLRTTSPDADDQRAALKAAGITRPTVETTNEPQKKRPAFARLMARAKPGDTIVVASLTALGKSSREVIYTARAILDADLVLRVLDIDQTITKADEIGGFITALAAAQTALLDERIKGDPGAGRTGRPPASEERIAKARELLGLGYHVDDVTRMVPIGEATLYRHGVLGRKPKSSPRK